MARKKGHKGKHLPYSHGHRCVVTIETDKHDPPFTDATAVTGCKFQRKDGNSFDWIVAAPAKLLPSGRLVVFLIANDPPPPPVSGEKKKHQQFDDDTGFIVISTEDPPTDTPMDELTVEPIFNFDPCSPPTV